MFLHHLPKPRPQSLQPSSGFLASKRSAEIRSGTKAKKYVLACIEIFARLVSRVTRCLVHRECDIRPLGAYLQTYHTSLCSLLILLCLSVGRCAINPLPTPDNTNPLH